MSVSVVMVYLDLWFEHFDIGEADSLAQKVVIMLKRSVSGREVPVGRAVVLLKARVLSSTAKHALQHSPEVDAREQAVVWDHVILPVGLVIMQVLE
jgi:hypothetical protein